MTTNCNEPTRVLRLGTQQAVGYYYFVIMCLVAPIFTPSCTHLPHFQKSENRGGKYLFLDLRILDLEESQDGDF
jgi:hypothetical protein